MKKNIICFVAGHSGGHIIPCATQAKKELAENPNSEILFFCTDNSLDQKILNNYDFIKYKKFLSLSNIPRNPLKFINFILKLNISFIKSFLILKKLKPTKIVSMGGLISIPVCLAGKLLNIPIELWELNVEPGKTINFLSKLTNNINVCFEETKTYLSSKDCKTKDYPIRFNENSKISNRNRTFTEYNLSNNFKTILIIGGSQGSHFINNAFKQWVTENKSLKNIQVIHQTGSTDFNWQNFYQTNAVNAITFTFNNKIEDFYNIADLIICRAGAGTLAEALFFEKQCITIPLETKSTNHQVLNASSLAKKHPNLHVVKQDKNPYQFFSKINELIQQ